MVQNFQRIFSNFPIRRYLVVRLWDEFMTQFSDALNTLSITGSQNCRHYFLRRTKGLVTYNGEGRLQNGRGGHMKFDP